jgi:hypothetical protein
MSNREALIALNYFRMEPDFPGIVFNDPGAERLEVFWSAKNQLGLYFIPNVTETAIQPRSVEAPSPENIIKDVYFRAIEKL